MRVLIFSLIFSFAFGQVTIALNGTLPGQKTGNCISGRMNFNRSRIFALGGNEERRKLVDPGFYDWTYDNGRYKQDGDAIELELVKNEIPGQLGANSRFSSTRLIKYGRIRAYMTPSSAPGVVSSFIMMSDIGQKASDEKGELKDINDEIDWEILGKDISRPQYNVFTYRSTRLELSGHGGPINTPVTPDVPHVFGIDWRHDRIDWSIDDEVVQTVYKAQSFSLTNSIPDGGPWFPTEPMRIQTSIWDGSNQASWAGVVDWNKSVFYQSRLDWVEVQCYDDDDNAVDSWPVNTPPPNTPSIGPKAKPKADLNLPGITLGNSAHAFNPRFSFILISSLIVLTV